MDGDEHNMESPPLEMELNDDDAVEVIELEDGQDVEGTKLFWHTSNLLYGTCLHICIPEFDDATFKLTFQILSTWKYY